MSSLHSFISDLGFFISTYLQHLYLYFLLASQLYMCVCCLTPFLSSSPLPFFSFFLSHVVLTWILISIIVATTGLSIIPSYVIYDRILWMLSLLNLTLFLFFLIKCIYLLPLNCFPAKIAGIIPCPTVASHAHRVPFKLIPNFFVIFTPHFPPWLKWFPIKIRCSCSIITENDMFLLHLSLRGL